ncbi:MAG: MmoB/DmpM family protein [Polyangiaceae bacterium]
MTPARVGPVLIDGETGRAVAAAIVRANDQAVVTQRGGYVRVSAPSPCTVTRAGVEDELGRAFCLRGDLETAMTSFQGRLQLDDEVARWV